jgi:hypothetical protein
MFMADTFAGNFFVGGFFHGNTARAVPSQKLYKNVINHSVIGILPKAGLALCNDGPLGECKLHDVLRVGDRKSPDRAVDYD